MSTKTASRKAAKKSAGKKASGKKASEASGGKSAGKRAAGAKASKAAGRKASKAAKGGRATSTTASRGGGRAPSRRRTDPVTQLVATVAETATRAIGRAVEQFSTYVIQAGDTLAAIAQNSSVTLEVLLGANPDIKNPNRISVGQQIRIPILTPGGNGANGDGAASSSSSSSSVAPEPEAAAGGSFGLNAILFEAETAGAADGTARQDKLPQKGVRGVAASNAMADLDRKRVMAHKAKFIEAGARFGLPPALLAAIASRESRGGAALKNGFGDGGHGFGLMQVDDRNPFGVVKEGGPAGLPHIIQASGILRDKLKAVRAKFPTLPPVRQLQTAVSRYNGGSGKPFPDSDRGTTGGDYMSDTWARARHYARVESWEEPEEAAPRATRSSAAGATRGVPAGATRGVGTRSARAATGDEGTPEVVPASGTRGFNWVPAPPLEDVREGRRVLHFGHRGESAAVVQRLLGLEVDSRFGSDTRDAVAAFQRGHGLDDDGRVGRLTLAALEGAPAESPTPSAPTSETLSPAAPAEGSLARIDPKNRAANVHPELKRRLGLLDGALAARGLQARITDGLRTFAHQNAIFAQGREPVAAVNALRKAAGLSPISAEEAGRKVTGVRGGGSNHNYGLAVDMYPVVNGQIVLDPAKLSASAREVFRETQLAIGEESERLGMTWGGRWKKLVDTPHVQLFPLDEMTPQTCLKIFREHGDSMEAVWAEATRRLRG